MSETAQAQKGGKGNQQKGQKGQKQGKGKNRRAGLTTREEDFSQWYLEVIQRADMAHHSAVKGCMVIKPYGFAIWEQIKDTLDGMIKATGHVNAYFPLFIPVSFLEKEAEHVEGFAMECAVVTHHKLEKDGKGGLRPAGELEAPLIVRPTSETIIWHTVKQWIQSWRDLPLLLNQWANVVRWEMRTRLFLRTTEFLWQEGHTAHATHEEGVEETLKMLGVYQTLLSDYFGIHVTPGRKSEAEKFPGAVHTYTVEAMMQDKKALQAGTSHDLGQNFSKAFDVSFQDQDGKTQHVWTTSWGVSTRLIGALIMAHSDDNGLIVPPKLAPIQVVVVPFMRKDADKEKVVPALERVREALTAHGIRFKIDDRDHLSPGNKFYEWEGKGVPLRMEVGPKDVDKGQVVLVRRDTGEKQFVPEAEALAGIPDTLATIQNALYERHKAFTESNIVLCSTYDELKAVIAEDRGFALCPWAGDTADEKRVKEETKATLRCIPNAGGAAEPGDVCIVTGEPARERALFGRAY
ncbi:MAG: proline--tRNA ligase [Planctomycetota bacterium]|jgi:prolyl-tRNA synthetase